MCTLKAVNVAMGTTMLVTIHQPSLDSYRLFDGLVLLHRGALCYFGEGGEAPCAFLEQQVRSRPSIRPALTPARVLSGISIPSRLQPYRISSGHHLRRRHTRVASFDKP